MGASERMKELLLAQFADKPNIEAFLDIVGNELDELDRVREQLRTQIYPSTAKGKQLDICGEVVGIERKLDGVVPVDFFGFINHGEHTFGEGRFRRLYDNLYTTNVPNDDMYRMLIHAKIAKNVTDGSRQSTIDSLRRIFGTTSVTVSNAGDAKAKIGIGRGLGKNEIRLIKITDLAVHGAGIGIDYYYYYEAGHSFGFSRGGINYNKFMGMGNLKVGTTSFEEGGHYLFVLKGNRETIESVVKDYGGYYFDDNTGYYILSIDGGVFSRLIRKEDT